MAQFIWSFKIPHIRKTFHMPRSRLLPTLHLEKQSEQAHAHSSEQMLLKMLSLQASFHAFQTHAAFPIASWWLRTAELTDENLNFIFRFRRRPRCRRYWGYCRHQRGGPYSLSIEEMWVRHWWILLFRRFSHLRIKHTFLLTFHARNMK